MSSPSLNQAIADKLSLISLPKVSLSGIRLFGFALITLFIIFYIFQISEITKSSFLSSKYEQEIIRLSQQNKNMEIRLSQENSLVNLEALVEKLNYEKVDKVYYIKIIETGVAAKPQ